MTVQNQLAQSQDLVCQELREELWVGTVAASLQNKETNKGVVPITLKVRTRILAQPITSTQKPNKNYIRTNNKLHKNNTYTSLSHIYKKKFKDIKNAKG